MNPKEREDESPDFRTDEHCLHQLSDYRLFETASAP
jgi:hypothetical protein